MITGFNPADMYGVDHIRRVLTTFPGVFTGIGEFSIHKEFVSSKIAGETASLTNPALDRILDFAGRGRPRRDPAQRHRHAVRQGRHRAGLPDADEGAAEAASEDDDHLGAHRPRAGSSVRCRSRPRPPSAPDAARDSSACWPIRRSPRQLRHLVGRGREVRRGSPESIARVATCSTVPRSASCSAPTPWRRPVRAVCYAVFDMWAPVWRLLTPDASLKVRKGNYERIFDEGRRRVRAWEKQT